MLVDGGLYASLRGSDLVPSADSFVPGARLSGYPSADQADVGQDQLGSWAIPRSPPYTPSSSHSPPLTFPTQPVPSQDGTNWQDPMTNFGVSRVSANRYPGAPIVPTVWQPSLPQNGAVNPSSLVIGNRDLSQRDSTSSPSYILRDSGYQPLSPAPSTSIDLRTVHSGNPASAPVSVFACQCDRAVLIRDV